MKYVNKNTKKNTQTRVIVALATVASVLAIGVGVAGVKIATMQKQMPVQISVEATENQEVALKNNEAEIKVVTAAHVEEAPVEVKTPLQVEAEKWFSAAELEGANEFDLPMMIQLRKAEYGKYLNAEEMKLTYIEKLFLYEKRVAEEAKKEAEAAQKAAEAAKKEAEAAQNAVMTLNITDMTLKVGEQVTLKANLSNNPQNAYYSWNMNDSYVATVSPNGKNAVITAKNVGTTVVSVTSGNTKATCIVRVKSNETFSLDTGKVTMEEGDFYSVGASSKIKSVKINDTYIADVSFEGKQVYISARNAGTAKITVTGKNGKSASMTLTVTPYAPYLNATKMSLNVGDTKDLYITKGPSASKWYSDNPSVARIYTNGKGVTVEGVGAGTTNIVAVTGNGYAAYCTVTVKAPVNPPAPVVKALKLDVSEATIYAGEIQNIHVLQGSANNWTISNDRIADIYVVGDGSMVQVVAKEAGSAVITAYGNDGTNVKVFLNVEAVEQTLADGFEPIAEMVGPGVVVEEEVYPMVEEEPVVEETYPPVEEVYEPIVEETYPPVVEEVQEPVVEETQPPVVEEVHETAAEEIPAETEMTEAE